MKKASPQLNPVLRCMRWCLGLLLVLIVGGVLWLLVGMPGGLVSRVLNPKLPAGFQMAVSEFRYTPGHGFRFSEFELYSNKDRVTPIFQAEEVALNPHVFQRLRHGEWTSAIQIRNGRVETNLGTWADDLSTDQMLRIHQINGELDLKREQLSFEHFEGSLPNLELHLSGAVALGEFAEKPEPTLIPHTAQVVSEVLRFLDGFQFRSSPVVQMNFLPASGETDSARIDLVLAHLGPSHHRGFAFNELKVNAVYAQKRLKVNQFLVRENAERALSGSAEINFAEDQFEVEIQNTLRRFGLEAISPFSLSKLLDRLQLRVEDRCDFSIKLGPSSFKHPGNKIQGTFQVENAFFRDAFFPEISFNVDLNLPRMKLSQLDGVLGQGKGKGPFKGETEMDFKSGFHHIDVDGAFYPDLAISMVGSMAEKYLREWEFRGPAPEFSARLDQAQTGQPMQLEVEADGREVLWRGTAFDHVGGKVTYKDEKLSILDTQASRGKEHFAGNLKFTPGFKGCNFEIESDFHLPDVLQLIGPQVAKLAQPFRFRGRSQVNAKGFLDFNSPPSHDLQGHFEFEDLVWRWLSLNKLSGSVELKGERLEVPDLSAQLEGGTLNANFRSENTFSESGRFALSMNLKNMDLYKVITKATDLEDTPYKGNLSLDLNLTGALRDGLNTPKTDSYLGRGKLEIREGSLFRIPLLLGLSEILNKLVHGFGYASQSDFTADFEIEKGLIKSPELFLQGNILSIAGPGSYRIADRKISADLKIHLLKDGILSDALKVILWPIRKLVEVQLTGTLDHPDWQPKNLPKEIFGK